MSAYAYGEAFSLVLANTSGCQKFRYQTLGFAMLYGGQAPAPLPMRLSVCSQFPNHRPGSLPSLASSTVRRSGRLAPSMPVSSSTFPALPPQPS
jgi:hypothetical protein